MINEDLIEIDGDDPFAEDAEESSQLFTRKELTNSRSRLRSLINRDAANSDKRARQLASQLLSQQHPDTLKHKEKVRQSGAFLSSVGSLASKVLNSMGISPRIDIQPLHTYRDSPPMRCYTDFIDINIHIDVSKFDLRDNQQIIEFIHTVKGFTYHEGGHIMWSTPPEYLCKIAGCRNHHVISGSVIKNYVDATTLTSLTNKNISSTAFQQAWNILEDQRMESAMVTISPVLSRYFSTLVAKYVYDPGKENIAWPWIVGRTYLPRELRQLLRNAAETHKYASIIPNIEKAVMTYRSSNDPVVMHQCVLALAECLILWLEGAKGDGLQNPDQHGVAYRYGEYGNNSNRIAPVPESTEYELEQVQPQSGLPNSEGEDTDDKSDNQPDTGGDASNEASDENPDDKVTVKKSAGSGAAPKNVRDYFDDIISNNLAQVSHGDVTDFISNVNTNLSQIAARDESMTKMSSDEIKETTDIQNGMLDVLDKLIVQVDPSWMFYRENGVLDPTAFITRDPGEMNFWSGMDGDKGNGHDLAVSILVDTSGSMDHRIGRTSAVTMGIRKACEHYDIPCTVTTFSDRVRLVVAGDETTDYVKLGAGGGTHIFEALSLLDDQRYGKRYHLVVIVTDGEWSDIKDVRAWGDPGRHILVVGIDVPHELISNKGGNSAVTIYNPSELAPLVTNALSGYFIN